MTETKGNLQLINSNTLKIIAAFSMVIDHIGYLLFPEISILRIIGRLAFPIFAFMIAEGCKYTKNKLRYFLTVFGLGTVCQIVYYVFSNSLDMCILVTFSLSILMIYSMQNFKCKIFSKESSASAKIMSCVIFVMSVGGVYILNTLFRIDYGFWGCMIPVFASLFQINNTDAPESLKKFDCTYVNVLSMGAGLAVLAIVMGGNQYYSLLSLILLFLYSGTRGKRKMKCFFYVFYPAHLTILQGFYILLK